MQRASQTFQLFSVPQFEVRYNFFVSPFFCWVVVWFLWWYFVVQCGSAPSSSMESEVCSFPNGITVCGVSWLFHSKEKLLVLLFFYRISTSNRNMWFSIPSYANSSKCTCALFYLQLHDEFCAERTELHRLHPFSSLRYSMQRSRRK